MADLRIAGGDDRPAAGWEASLKVDKKTGGIKGDMHNLMLILENDEEVRGRLRYDELGKTVVVGGPFEGHSLDVLPAEVSFWLTSKHGIDAAPRTIEDALLAVARRHPFDPLKDHLRALEWDGVARLDYFLEAYMGVAPTEDPRYVRAVSRRWLISLVARALRPGCKVDTVLVVEGPQGRYKTTAFEIIGERWFVGTAIAIGEKDGSMIASGAWIVELGELSSLKRAETDRVKQYLSASTDTFRLPYGRVVEHHPRRCVFVGTTNEDAYLKDSTGNRRYWPVACKRVDVEALRRDRGVLLAEAVRAFDAGERWWLTEEESALAEIQGEERYEQDAWTDGIIEWTKNPRSPSGTEIPISTANILEHAVGKNKGQWNRWDENRVGSIMRRAGFIKHKGHGNIPRIWRRP